MKAIVKMSIGCMTVVGLAVCFLTLRADSVIVPMDDQARKQADIARKEWARRNAFERWGVERKHLEGMAIPDLAKRAVSILVRHENPAFIVNKAIVTTEFILNYRNGYDYRERIARPPWGTDTAPKDKRIWSMVYEEATDENHHWWIEQHNYTRHYRLIDYTTRKIHFSILDESKLRTVLAFIVMHGDAKPFYQVVDGDTYVQENYCVLLPISAAQKIFPETLNLAEGIYAKHPCNKYALVPVADFHASLAMDKAVECIVLLGRMGAKSVHVSRMEDGKNCVGGGMGVTVKGVDANVNATLVSAMKSKFDINVEFSGNSHADIPQTLLENSIWHKTDKNLIAILSARLSDNKVKNWNVMEEEQSDYSFDFKAAASVLKIAEADLKANYEKMKHIRRTFHVVFD